MQQNRRGNGWIGWLIFFLLIFGSRLLPPVANWLSQVTGLPITTPILIAAIVGLGVVTTIITSVSQEVARNRGADSSRLPTGLPPTGSLPQAPKTVSPSRSPYPPERTVAPPPIRPPADDQRLPGPPRFEPIIDPRILTFGIIGLVIFGGFFLVAFFIGGGLP